MPLERHIAAFEEQVEVLATMDIGAMWDRVRGEFLDAFVRFDRQGLSDDALEREMLAFMEGLSEKPVEKLARGSSTVAYNEGRSAEILSSKSLGLAEFVVRSELLEDPNICSNCVGLDSIVVEIGSPDYFEFQPPAGCLGLTNCRGFYVAVGAA